MNLIKTRRSTADIIKTFSTGISDLFAHAEAQERKVSELESKIISLELEADEREEDAERARRVASKLEALLD